MELTKDAKLLACCAYKEYLIRRKSGIPKRTANAFHKDFANSCKELSSWIDDDYLYTVSELKRAGFVRTYFDGMFSLTDQCIVYMENKFKQEVIDTVDFISKLIP